MRRRRLSRLSGLASLRVWLSEFGTCLARARAAAGVLRAHPRLLVVPAVTVVAGTLLFLPLLWGLNRGGRWVLSAGLRRFGLAALAGLPVLFYLLAVVFLATYALLLLFDSAVLVHCTRQYVDDEPVSLAAGVRAAVGATPQLLAFALAFGVVGVVLAAIERAGEGVSDLVVGVLGASVTVTAFFVVPAAVLDGAGPREAFRRSVETVREAFAETAVLSLGVVSATVTLLAVPYLLALFLPVVVGVERANALIEQQPLLYGGVPTFSLWVGLVAGVSLGAVAKTGLYLAVRDGRESVPVLAVPVDEAVRTAD